METKIQELLNLEITKANVDEIDKNVKNLLKDLYAEMKTIPNEQKREVGAKINEFRTKMEEKIKTVKQNNASSKKVKT